MLVSIITVCYNSEKTVRKTVESVLGQTYGNIEYIVVDGLSTDGTVDAVREYAPAFSEKGISLRIVSEKDRGIYDAMNKGIAMAKGEIIGIVNSDDWYEPNAVEVAAAAREKTGFDMFYADLNVIRENGEVILKRSRRDRFPSTRHWNHPTTFVTKDTYDSLGAFRCQGLYDDFDLMLRIRRAGKKIVIENQPLSNFRLGGASHKKSFSEFRRKYRDRYRCYRNNGYSPLYFAECFGMEFAKLFLK